MAAIVLVRGGGDLATGVVLRLVRSGLRVVITELPQPLAVRRTVSFAEAVYARQVTVEGITAHCLKDPTDSLGILTVLGKQQVPVLVDPDCTSAKLLHAIAVVDARLAKRPPEPIGYAPALYIGLGPGFIAGTNCQAAIETRRGHTLGRVYWTGGPQADTGSPEGDPRRVLRAPCSGKLVSRARIGDLLEQGQPIATVGADGQVLSPFKGILRGLVHDDLEVTQGMKIGDVDARGDPSLCSLVSDKALSVGGGVLEALLARPEVRRQLWT